VSISPANVMLAEGNVGTTPFVHTVSLSAASTQQITVVYATANGTAAAGSDYMATSGTLTFAPGVTSQLLTVFVIGDTAVEQDETFSINLSSPVNAALGASSSTDTISNDDLAVVSLAQVSATEGSAATTPFVFTISLSQSSFLPVTVSYSTVN